MIRLFSITLVLIGLSACVGKNPATEIEKPSNLISKKEFVPLLTEVSLIEAAHQMRYIQVARYSSLLQSECDSLFKVKNTSREAFEATMKYYTMLPKEMKLIYEEVNKEIEKRKSELVIEPEDSIEPSNDSADKIKGRIMEKGILSKME